MGFSLRGIAGGGIRIYGGTMHPAPQKPHPQRRGLGVGGRQQRDDEERARTCEVANRQINGHT